MDESSSPKLAVVPIELPSSPLDFKIAGMAIPHGDWYEVQCYRPENRWFIARVCLWVYGREERSRDHIKAITNSWVPGGADRVMPYHVFGTDKAPNGKTWDAIYQAAPVTFVNCREIADPDSEN